MSSDGAMRSTLSQDNLRKIASALLSDLSVSVPVNVLGANASVELNMHHSTSKFTHQTSIMLTLTVPLS